jgi:hypothetical protein
MTADGRSDPLADGSQFPTLLTFTGMVRSVGRAGPLRSSGIQSQASKIFTLVSLACK